MYNATSSGSGGSTDSRIRDTAFVSFTAPPDAVSIPRALELPESAERRRTELHLFHHYITRTGQSLVLDGPSKNVWIAMIPEFSLYSDALQYTMYSVTAMHLAKSDASRRRLASDLAVRYLDLGLCESKKELLQLKRSSVDKICMTAGLLRICAFVLLQDRARQPYTPPLEWLRMSHSTVDVYKRTAQMLGLNGETAIASFWKSVLMIRSSREKTRGSQHALLDRLLLPLENQEVAEDWNSEIRAAYESAVNYIGGVMFSIEQESLSLGEVSRRLVLFPVLVDRGFVSLVEEGQPRALVVLAHYFGLLSIYAKNVWYVGDAGRREVSGIQSFLPPEWQSLMTLPLQLVGSKIR